MWSLTIVSCLVGLASTLRYDPEQVDYNLNQNQQAVDPLDYSGEWQNHKYTPSPSNWRFPFYTLFIDKFVNGDPTNDNANGTFFEHDLMGNQLRHGGDLVGFVDTLDYIQGMGIKAIYVAGSPYINLPWGADSYSPLDLTLLDHHFGTIQDWRNAVNEVHKRGMYIVLDNTMATMGDLIGFEGFLNETTPFSTSEHHSLWKNSRRYHDFSISNKYNDTCQYPRFWLETGSPVGQDVLSQLNGCYDSDFDQYGDREAFGVYPDWQRQLTKFASVQDRLREWHVPVRKKIEHFSCMTIGMLDIDGFRMDKAGQVTVDAQSEWADAMRQCAKRYGKENFFIPGEITGGNTFGSIYLGRGKEPKMASATLSEAVKGSNYTDSSLYIRPAGKQALDSAAFHYTIYRSLTRFLGMDGNLASGYDAPVNWVDAWNTMLLTNDLINANTGKFDPRHMYGVTNQDVFRWPAIKDGTQRMLLGLFIATLHMPGIPLLLWGEEQAFYVLDNTANNYIFGRQAMSPALAWQTHGCYHLDSSQYYQFPLDKARNGCQDDWNGLDHRDPSAPIRNIIKSMYHMRESYPVLSDGFFLQKMSNQTRLIQMPGSNGIPTETGIWSVMRGRFSETQDFGKGNQSVWLVYHNENTTVDYEFDCSKNDSALVSPYDTGVTVKNLFWPHDEYTMTSSPKKLGLEGSTKFNGCIGKLRLEPYGYKAFVPKANFIPPPPMVTKFTPGHDARILVTSAPGQASSIKFSFQFSARMSCDSIQKGLQIASATEGKQQAVLDAKSVACSNVDPPTNNSFVGGIPTAFTFEATLTNVFDGVHSITITNATTGDSKSSTNAVDKFLIRVGRGDNPMVFTRTANYTKSLLSRDASGTLIASHKAAGADKFRYSLDFGSTYSDWEDYKGGNTTLRPKNWTGTKRQAWDGEHIIMQYWSRLSGSSAHVQHGDLEQGNKPARRFPHVFLHGPFNAYGYDAGVHNTMAQQADGRWSINFMEEWPAKFQFNVWGVNPDGEADQTLVFGDADGDSIIDRMPPSALGETVVNITFIPAAPYLSYQIFLDDGSYRFDVVPVGSRSVQLALFVILAIVPLVTGGLAIWMFMLAFYKVKFNKVGFKEKRHYIPTALRNKMQRLASSDSTAEKHDSTVMMAVPSANVSAISLPQINEPAKRRCVLIATMEYDIEDWAIKIKIGGLGVMAQLMGKNLGHQDLIWVVPCVGGIDYPVDTICEPMNVTILGSLYEVKVQTHQLNNITYVLLDAPVFRQQTKSEPYPPRMDDLDSAIYYSAWNQCIAFAIQRFDIDLYHINDYHGAVAPLHLLPGTVPCCFSLHNAEFQGLWPMRTTQECVEVCSVYNLDPALVERYVQFGNVFNLLHAGSSYLRIHQRGFGAVGVSKKYGKRSFARYPIFWGLDKVGQLPNPDPTDLTDWDGKALKSKDVVIDPEYESGRIELKRQAQEWAGLDQNPDAELMVFVGRWSMQKGVDLIADIMPSVLEENKNVQLVCVGPVIDLYGKFAALKLARMMEIYPGRVFSKPEFTALPPFIFSGAEFALIPSRDEPFGLVAVEFGRKGALGIGAKVGGLGQMPGWWYTVESTTTSHVLNQFRAAINDALASKTDLRANMRARSAKQRFPVSKWVEQLETLQSTAIKIHNKERHGSRSRSRGRSRPVSGGWHSGTSTPGGGADTPSAFPKHLGARLHDALSTRPHSPSRDHSPMRDPIEAKPSRVISLGYQVGPGHQASDSLSAMEQDARHTHEHLTDDEGVELTREVTMTREEAEKAGMVHAIEQQQNARRGLPHADSGPSSAFGSERDLTSLTRGRQGRPPSDQSFLSHMPFASPQTGSTLSVDMVVGDRKDFQLQRVDPFFTDSTGEFYDQFSKRLTGLNGKNSEDDYCIEEFLAKSEKKWFNRFKDAKLGINSSASSTPTPSLYKQKRLSKPPPKSHMNAMVTDVNDSAPNSAPPSPPAHAIYFNHNDDEDDSVSSSGNHKEENDEFALGIDFKPPTGLKKYMCMRIGDWPLYSFLLAFGQIIAANSYQITLLTGEIGQTATKLYVVASIYLISSILWWGLFRTFKAVYTLTLPFFFYGLAFLLIAVTPYVSDGGPKNWVQNVATGFYALASASGSFYFGLNWGDQGGAPTKTWCFRACLIQGTSQLYVTALWFWGSALTKQTAAGVQIVNPITNTYKMTIIAGACTVLLWTVGIVLFIGLPSFYRQTAGTIPSFYRSLSRRKVILWFFVAVIIQNYWLSSNYGRNWAFLWSSKHAKNWQIALLIFTFFVVIWAIFLAVFGWLSGAHSWILPVFALGLGAPRFAQILWAISGIGSYLPWAGGPVSSALLSRTLWLWLAVLDSLQGVGIGMLLLQTLTRFHVIFTLISAQVIGSVATIIGRAASPCATGPGSVFGSMTGGVSGLTGLPWFWVALIMNLCIPLGFAWRLRFETLSKP